jgi:putative SOS response-associated peptidase YedK
MCGRYGRRADKQRIAEWMQTHNTNVFDDSYLVPSYNVAPQSFQPVVRLDAGTGQRELTRMRWGLVPFWAKDAKIAYSTINAKAETIAGSPAFREAWKRRRCLVPADFFYEWKKLDAKAKQPYAISLSDGSLFAFAGLWDRWKDKATGQELETYTIITTDANELIHGMSIHDRMPVILKPADYSRWLNTEDPHRLPLDLLRPYEAEQMKAWKVGQGVGNVRNNGPELCEPLGGDESSPQRQIGEPEPQQDLFQSSEGTSGEDAEPGGGTG